MRVLIIKTSSLGDVVHTLPALTDAARARAGIVFDWAVEPAFAAVPAWHGAVADVIALPLRGARNGGWRALRDAIGRLRLRRYDAVIDAQGLLKSAAATLFARGPKHGLDRASAREGLASTVYGHAHAVPRDMHAIARTRALFAAALGYAVPDGAPDYGVDRGRIAKPAMARPYVVLIHGTTWATKEWTRWRELAQDLARQGMGVAVPAHGVAESARAEAICAGIGDAIVLPPGLIADVATAIAGAAGAVAVDTGLAHVAAALGVPCVTLYGPTSPALTGTIGAHQARIASDFDCAPCRARICARTGKAEPPPCLAALDPARVLGDLRELMR